MKSNTSRRKASVLVVTVFTIGFLAGALAMNLYFATVKGASPWPAAHRRESKKELLDTLTQELKLAPDQTQQIDAILSETREEYLRLRKQSQPQYEQIRARSRERIRQVLHADQLQPFEEMLRRIDEERRKYREKESR